MCGRYWQVLFVTISGIAGLTTAACSGEKPAPGPGGNSFRLVGAKELPAEEIRRLIENSIVDTSVFKRDMEFREFLKLFRKTIDPAGNIGIVVDIEAFSTNAENGTMSVLDEKMRLPTIPARMTPQAILKVGLWRVSSVLKPAVYRIRSGSIEITTTAKESSVEK